LVSFNLRNNLLLFVAISTFILFYFIYLLFFYIIPLKLNISVFLLLGFAIVIFCFFTFFYLNPEKSIERKIKIKIISEDFFKIFLLLIICLSFLIKPINGPSTVILWAKISPLNYFKAICIIIGCAFLPGANIFNIFFPNNKLHEKFKTEAFLLKITLYPLLSFIVIGLTVLVVDQIGLVNQNYFYFSLFVVILSLFFIDLFLKKLRKISFKFKSETLNFSKYTLLILIISIGILFISVGINLGNLYLLPGDSWGGLTAANYISVPNTSPVEKGEDFLYYPIFWSYIIYGLSTLTGLPFINTNVLLAPFCYLYVLCVFFFMKAILYEFKEKYSILSTILMIFFSGLFYFSSNFSDFTMPGINFVGEFYFIYKSYSMLLLLFSLALFIITIKTKSIETNQIFNLKFNIEEIKQLFFASLLILFCFMVYAIGLLIGLIFILLYCLILPKKSRNLSLFSIFVIFLIVIFILMDFLMNFYPSSAAYFSIQWFFKIGFLNYIFSFFPTNFLIYSCFLGLFLLIKFLNLLYSKYLIKKQNLFSKFKKNPKKIFKYCIIVFSIFLIVEFVSIILELFFLNYYLNEKLTFFYILDKVFINIGFVGILAVYLSYFSFIKKKKLFYFLIVWTMLIFLIAFALSFLYILNNFAISLNSISNDDLFIMNFWFNRNWYYSIISISIISSIGLIKGIKYLKSHPRLKGFLANKYKKNILKFISLSFIVVLIYSNTVYYGFVVGNTNTKPSKDEIEVIGWMSENLPEDSKIIIEYNYMVRLGVYSMSYASIYYIHYIFKSDYTQTELLEEIDFLRDEEIQYLLVSKEYFSENGTVQFFIRNYVIPNFYNQTEYDSDEFRIYYAPFFD